MDFGQVPSSELSQIDYRLPPEPYQNSQVLKGAAPSQPTKFFVGLSKWGQKEWLGKLYPKVTKDAQFLDEYQKHYNSIELNATHYKLHNEEDIQN